MKLGPTRKLLLSFHPPDGGGRLAAHGRARHLGLVPLLEDLVSGFDDRVPWRNYIMGTVSGNQPTVLG